MLEGIDWTPVVRELVLLIAAVLVVLKGPIAAFIRSKAEALAAEVGDKRMKMFVELCKQAVSVAEMLGGTGAEKKQMATNYVLRGLTRYGLEFGEAEVSNGIEAALAYAKDVFYAPMAVE